MKKREREKVNKGPSIFKKINITPQSPPIPWTLAWRFLGKERLQK